MTPPERHAVAPTRIVHASHKPEPPEKRFFPHCTYCMVCCRLIDSTPRGVTDRGAKGCPGPSPIELRREVRDV